MILTKRKQIDENNKDDQELVCKIRMPRGYGSIRYLGKGRKRPYAVHSPAVRVEAVDGVRYRYEKPICYVGNWLTGFVVLIAWHARRYQRGLEEDIYRETKKLAAMKENGSLADISQAGLEEMLFRMSQGISKDTNQYASQSINQTMSQSTSQGTKQKMSQNTIQGIRQNQSISQGTKQNMSQNRIQGIRQNQSINQDMKQELGQDPGQDVNPGRRPDRIWHRNRGRNEDWNPGVNSSVPRESLTLLEAYERFYQYKFGPGAPKKLKQETAENTAYLVKKLEPFYDRELDSLTVDELQLLVSGLPLGKIMLTKTVILLKQIYNYAVSRDLCSKNPAHYLQVPDAKDIVHHQDFTDQELAVLWKHADDKVFRMMLIMCYCGFRISEFQGLEINIEKMYFRGGIKTEAGMNRIVPIHSGILHMVKELKASGKTYLVGSNKDWFRKKMAKKLREAGIDVGDRHHSPHSCRHTFSRLCESYGVREADRKRMMGHSFQGDITNGVYGHRSLEELKKEIEKIRIETFSELV